MLSALLFETLGILSLFSIVLTRRTWLRVACLVLFLLFTFQASLQFQVWVLAKHTI